MQAVIPTDRDPETMIDLRYVKKLVEMLDESTVDSIEISSDKGMKIRISKTPSQRGTMQVAAPMAVQPAIAERRPTRAGRSRAPCPRPRRRARSRPREVRRCSR